MLEAADPESDDIEDARDDPEAVKLMVEYFYHYDYFPDVQTLNLHAKVFALAVKYQVDGLQGLAKDKFADIATTTDIITYGELVEATNVVYRSTPDYVRTLRDIVVLHLSDNYSQLRQTSDAEAILRSLPTLAYDLLEYQHTHFVSTDCSWGHLRGCSPGQVFWCDSCDEAVPFCHKCRASQTPQHCACCGAEYNDVVEYERPR